MKAKHLMIAGIATLALGTAAILPLVSVSADEAASTVETSFIQKLAEKLGLNQEAVQTAVDSTKEEIHTERKAERESAISEAVTSGTLTQRQADILNAIGDAMRTIHEGKTQEDREAMRELSQEDRRSAMEEELVTALNNAGLNTNIEEVTAARDTAKSADILPAGPRGGRGPGGFGGQRMGL